MENLRLRRKGPVQSPDPEGRQNKGQNDAGMSMLDEYIDVEVTAEELDNLDRLCQHINHEGLDALTRAVHEEGNNTSHNEAFQQRIPHNLLGIHRRIEEGRPLQIEPEDFLEQQPFPYDQLEPVSEGELPASPDSGRGPYSCSTEPVEHDLGTEEVPEGAPGGSDNRVGPPVEQERQRQDNRLKELRAIRFGKKKNTDLKAQLPEVKASKKEKAKRKRLRKQSKQLCEYLSDNTAAARRATLRSFQRKGENPEEVGCMRCNEVPLPVDSGIVVSPCSRKFHIPFPAQTSEKVQAIADLLSNPQTPVILGAISKLL